MSPTTTNVAATPTSLLTPSPEAVRRRLTVSSPRVGPCRRTTKPSSSPSVCRRRLASYGPVKDPFSRVCRRRVRRLLAAIPRCRCFPGFTLFLISPWNCLSMVCLSFMFHANTSLLVCTAVHLCCIIIFHLIQTTCLSFGRIEQ